MTSKQAFLIPLDFCRICWHSVENRQAASNCTSATFPRRGKYPQV